MLEPFKGELMLHPCALDYNANQCSNNCAYCFANTRNAARHSSPRTLVDLCYGRSSSTGLTRWLFDQGYAVCMSNRTDPLAVVNRRDTSVAFSALANVPNGLLVQTKGSRDVAGAISALSELAKPRVALYVSLTSRSREVLDRVEPGAATYDGRLSIIRYARSRGWPVLVGLNPLHEPWMPVRDLIDVVRDCLSLGVRDFLLQLLHISRFARENMRQSCAARLSDALQPYSARDYTKSVIRTMSDFEKGSGVRWMPTAFRPHPSHALDGIRSALGLTMRSTQDFVNFAVESGRRFFSFYDFIRVMTADNPALADYGARNLNGYLYCLNRGAWKESNSAKGAYTFRDVYRNIWENRRFGPSPRALVGGGMFVAVHGDDGKPVRTRDGQLVLVRCPSSFKAWEEKTMTLAALKRKGVDTDELDHVL